MKRIKSAPANICEMVNRKKLNNLNIKKESVVLGVVFKPNKLPEPINIIDEMKNRKKNEEKKIKNVLSSIIFDSFSETNKYIPETDNYYYSLLVEIFNNFLVNKLNKENIQNFILTIMTRIFFSQIYHTLLITYKDVIHIH